MNTDGTLRLTVVVRLVKEQNGDWMGIVECVQGGQRETFSGLDQLGERLEQLLESAGKG